MGDQRHINQCNTLIYMNIYFKNGGERGIRTPGPFRVNGFQDRRIRPLCQLSCVLDVMFVLFRRRAWRHKQRFAPVCRRGRDQ
jgi:hypothetical protein